MHLSVHILKFYTFINVLYLILNILFSFSFD